MDITRTQVTNSQACLDAISSDWYQSSRVACAVLSIGVSVPRAEVVCTAQVAGFDRRHTLLSKHRTLDAGGQPSWSAGTLKFAVGPSSWAGGNIRLAMTPSHGNEPGAPGCSPSAPPLDRPQAKDIALLPRYRKFNACLKSVVVLTFVLDSYQPHCAPQADHNGVCFSFTPRIRTPGRAPSFRHRLEASQSPLR